MTARSVLWVGKAGVNGGGDEIFDRKLLAALDPSARVTRFEVPVQPRLRQIGNLLRGFPQPCFKYASPALDRDFRAAAASHDQVVISLEALEHFALVVDRPVTLILHNITHDLLGQILGKHPLGRLAAAWSLRWEQHLYARDTIHLVTLSQRDKALVEALAPGRTVDVACPGMPPPVPLQGTVIIPELVLSGSYAWHAKRRALADLAREVARTGSDFAWRHDLALPDDPAMAAIARVARPIEPVDYGAGLRFGLIPDDFLAGFKLKATYFIANNCVVLSRCDIRPEFDGLPFADQFVRYTPHLIAIADAMAALRARDRATLHREWLEFRDACAQRFSWQAAAQTVTGP